MRREWLVVVLGLLLTATPVLAGDNVRVVLDTSGSMPGNDPARLSTLATMLLFDLANPKTDDSFHVITFHPTVQWSSGQPAPVLIGDRIVAHPERREGFVQTLQRVAFAAKHTHFYPGLARAIADLEATPGGSDDRRVIVIITDGVPDPGAKAAELALIQADLVPRLHRAGIRLYVLAFGAQAAGNRAFFDDIVTGTGGNLGEVFPDASGAQLLDHMIEIFSRSFGYLAERSGPASAAHEVDLEGGVRAEHVAVVVYWPRPQPPRLRLSPAPRIYETDVREGREVGASYGTQWTLRPSVGKHRLDAGAAGATIAILRPVVVQLRIVAPSGPTSPSAAMARSPLRLRVLAEPVGRRGDPGPLHLVYRVHGPFDNGAFLWSERPQGASGFGVAGPDGRAFEIEAVFPRDPERGVASYVGHVEVLAKRREAVVGSLTRELAHRVTVYPLVRLAPSPSAGSAAASGRVRALGRYERGCAPFRLDVVTGPLGGSGAFPVRAVLDGATATDLRLRGASFTLDGHPIEFEGASRPAPASWFTGRTLGPAQLTGEHSLCIQVGRARGADLQRPADVKLRMARLDVPYDGADVIGPFVMRVYLSPPGWLERWAPPAALLAALAGVMALVWYGRDRPTLPDDLVFRIGEGNGADTVIPPGPSSVVLRTFALRAGAPLGGGPGVPELGWLEPVAGTLYQLKLRRGVVAAGAPGPMLDVVVHRTYELAIAGRSYRFRLEYR